MQRRHYLTILFFFCSFISVAQTSEWTWMGGDSVGQKAAIYGIQGVPSTLNYPPTLYEGCEWKDNSGNFWYYGGIHTDSLGMISTHGDLWRFNPVTLEWTWMNGPGINNLPPVYGTLRVPAATNYPGAKCFGAIGITDNDGIFWMFGGYNYGNSNFYSDLWSYDPATNMWTWMSGQTTNLYLGRFGTKGVPSPLNYPPAKQECNAGWADASNNIWIFGGQIPMGSGNDLWKFDVTTYEWTWMKGDSTTNLAGTYGTRGVPDPANNPGGRNVYSKWTDSDYNFWLFGGGGGGVFNDMWRYEVSTNQWTWMNGSSSPGSPGFVDTLCHFSAANNPGCRSENRTAWKDSCDNMYLFGGFGSSDLWVYNRFTNEFSKLYQGTSIPSFGIQGVSSASNSPSDKGGSSAWIDNDQNLWLFGGITGGMGYMNDLWRYVPDPLCIGGCTQAVPTAIFNSADNVICPGTCTDFINLSLQGNSFIWSFPGGTPNASTDVNPSNICYNFPGNYNVTLIASNSTGSDTLTLNNFITVYPQPPPQGIMQTGDTLFANPGATSYQWYYNGNAIAGATDYFYVATQSGDFNVVATDENDCEVEAVINDVIAEIQSVAGNFPLEIFPNPVQDKITIQDSQISVGSNLLISVHNIIGEKLIVADQDSYSAGNHEWTVDCKSLSAGVYILELTTPEKSFRTKFIKQ